jgi:hypothetical protein
MKPVLRHGTIVAATEVEGAEAAVVAADTMAAVDAAVTVAADTSRSPIKFFLSYRPRARGLFYDLPTKP